MTGLKLSWIARRYQVTRLLGQGGMGSVYEAVDNQTGARVAVKVIMHEMARNQTLMGRFEREAKAAATIDTPHIVRVLDAGYDQETGLPYMVMELLEGEDLQQVLRRVGPLSADLALRVAMQGCIALQKAHENRILHRDIKPANFFLAKQPDGEIIVKLLDFGVAKVKSELTKSSAETAGLTRTGSMLGSPLYMSPEQARGHKDLDYRSDLWSMGIVLYQALAGRTPHHDTDELGELIILICTEPPLPLQEVAPWVSPEVAAVVHRALRFQPDGRYQSASEMAASIRPFLTGGSQIHESMVVPISDSERNRVAQKVTEGIHDAPPGRRTQPGMASSSVGSGPASAPSSTSMPGALAGPPISGGAASAVSLGGVSAGGAASSTAGIGVTTVAGMQAQQPQRSALAAVLGAVLGAGLLLVGGVAVFFATRPPAAPATTTTAAVAPVDPKAHSVKVVILPADATVEVEGVAVVAKDGLVEIKGLLGSVHKVRVSSGGDEKTVEVVVTENGALPPKIDLVKAAAAPSASESASKPVPAATGPKRGAPLPTIRIQR